MIVVERQTQARHGLESGDVALGARTALGSRRCCDHGDRGSVTMTSAS